MSYNTKEKKLAYQRGWEKRNRVKRYAWNKKRIEESYKFINDIKSSGCSMCPEKDIVCLDFHHTDPKTKETNIARAINGGWSNASIQKEIDKCILVCSNCHRKIEAKIRKEK